MKPIITVCAIIGSRFERVPNRIENSSVSVNLAQHPKCQPKSQCLMSIHGTNADFRNDKYLYIYRIVMDPFWLTVVMNKRPPALSSIAVASPIEALVLISHQIYVNVTLSG